MTKILFVDDDAIARRNIRTKIDWKSYNWELIYTAKDAVDALDFMKQNQPDIILSDIKMPIMDGIQMAMVARNYYPDIKYIFILSDHFFNAKIVYNILIASLSIYITKLFCVTTHFINIFCDKTIFSMSYYFRYGSNWKSNNRNATSHCFNNHQTKWLFPC